MLLEAVPNLSLGPQSPLLDQLLDHLTEAKTPGWALLDAHTDPDHNRTVLTLAGARASLLTVLDRLVDSLKEHGSLVGHEGVHPRIGLLDVLPIVPLHPSGTRLARATAWTQARTLAEHEIPVYLYGDLARDSTRRQLAAIRRHVHWPGEAAALDFEPDLGPSRFHPTLGAACVGVRGLLVAYNVLLDSTDLQMGHRMARQLRASNDELPGLQTLAFPLASQNDRIQISMNLTQPQTIGLADVYQAVCALAKDHGIPVVGGELVGLAPASSLPEDPGHMGLRTLPESLEERLQAAGLVDGERVEA